MIRATILVFALHSVAGAQPLANALFRLNEIDLHYHSGMERPVSLDEWLRMAAADGRRVVALTDHLELYRKTPAEYEAWRAKGKFEARYPLGAPGHTALMRDFESAAQRHKLILFKAWEIYEGELDTGVEAAPMGMVDLIGWHISPNHAGAPPDGKLLLKRVAQIKEVQKRFPVPMILFHPFPMRLEHIQRKAKADGRDLASIRVDEYRFFQPGEQEQLAALRQWQSSPIFESLPETEKEVQALSRLFPPTRRKVLLGSEAREDVFKALTSNAGTIHFATHGVLDNRQPLYSFLLFSRDSNDPENDGLLEAREIMNLKLNARMAVLSACETARGRIGAGEGVVGISWAFFIAGCPTTVVSQWKVDSAAATNLMIPFYRFLNSQNPKVAVSKAGALRQAMIGLMRDARYRHPYYWAGFVVMGSDR